MLAIISVIIGLVQFIVGFRFLFLLLGANPSNAFVSWIYDLSSPLVAPFYGIFGHDTTDSVTQGVVTQSVFDWASLVALLVYGILGAILMRIASGYTRHRPVSY